MLPTTRLNRPLSAILLTLALVAAPAGAAYVSPQIGGGQVAMMGAPMKHADVTLTGNTVAIHLDDSVPTPQLRPLTGTDSFDPAQPWGVLQDKAYNFQYAWNPGGFITLPTGGAFWVEPLSITPGLEVYQRPPASPAYAPIFGTQASPLIWKWSGAMTHNVYAVLNPTLDTYAATYRVYLGDENTGQPLTGYNAAQITWTWHATPVPEPAALSLLGLGLLGRQGGRRGRLALAA